MTRAQQYLLDKIMNRFNLEYPKRYITGTKKYGTTIHKDYTIKEHINNLREELMDAFAYLEAIEEMYDDTTRENS